MINIKKLQTVMDECDKHANRLETAFHYLLPIFPMDVELLKNLSEVQLSYLDQLVYRFSRLQDAMGAKLFPILVATIEADVSNMTVIDILNRLEKANILSSALMWRDMREFRNHLTHEYPDNPELMVKNLNDAPSHVKILLDCWKSVKSRALSITFQLEK